MEEEEGRRRVSSIKTALRHSTEGVESEGCGERKRREEEAKEGRVGGGWGGGEWGGCFVCAQTGRGEAILARLQLFEFGSDEGKNGRSDGLAWPGYLPRYV